jgi:hypothetical protein
MKKTILTIVVLFFLMSTFAFAESCNVPKFIKKGAVINFHAGDLVEKNVKVIEIDEKSCWIKISGQQYFSWVNLNTMVGVTPKEE